MTMNLNPLILTNIQTSPYFKGPLNELKTYHEVVDEIYYKVRSCLFLRYILLAGKRHYFSVIFEW